jgi:alanine dehydrogenase
MALTSNTLRYGLEIANKGLERAAKENPNIMNGLNIYDGKCTNEAVAKSLGMKYWEPKF